MVREQTRMPHATLVYVKRHYGLCRALEYRFLIPVRPGEVVSSA